MPLHLDLTPPYASSVPLHLISPMKRDPRNERSSNYEETCSGIKVKRWLIGSTERVVTSWNCCGSRKIRCGPTHAVFIAVEMCARSLRILSGTEAIHSDRQEKDATSRVRELLDLHSARCYTFSQDRSGYMVI